MGAKDKLRENMTIPNAISILRLILIPVYVVIYLGEKDGSSLLAGIILIFSGLSDLLDGWIARRFNQISTLGKVLDPLADKLTTITVFICLCVNYFSTLWALFAFILIKEIIMMSVGYVMVKKRGFVYSSMWFGKVTTFAIYCAVTAFTIWPSLEGKYMQLIASVLLIMLAFSFFGYGNYLLNRVAEAELGVQLTQPQKAER